MSAMNAKLATVKTSIRHNKLNEPADGVFKNCYKVLGLLNIIKVIYICTWSGLFNRFGYRK